MNFFQFLFQQEEFVSKGLEFIFIIAGAAISIYIEILVAKYLIRFGIDYFYQRKQEYDSQRDIDEIQQDLFRSHDS